MPHGEETPPQTRCARPAEFSLGTTITRALTPIAALRSMHTGEISGLAPGCRGRAEVFHRRTIGTLPSSCAEPNAPIRHTMKHSWITKANLTELVAIYRAAAERHGQATAVGDSRDANRQHDVVAAVYRELRARGSSSQDALLPLMLDADTGVQTWAASHALEFAPAQGEPVLLAIGQRGGLFAFTANYTLKAWREGSLIFP